MNERGPHSYAKETTTTLAGLATWEGELRLPGTCCFDDLPR
jgi:hypothetical protein